MRRPVVVLADLPPGVFGLRYRLASVPVIVIARELGDEARAYQEAEARAGLRRSQAGRLNVDRRRATVARWSRRATAEAQALDQAFSAGWVCLWWPS